MMNFKDAKKYYLSIKDNLPNTIIYNNLVWRHSFRSDHNYTVKHNLYRINIKSRFLHPYTLLLIVSPDSNRKLLAFSTGVESGFMYLLMEKVSFYLQDEGWLKRFFDRSHDYLPHNLFMQKTVIIRADKILNEFHIGGFYDGNY